MWMMEGTQERALRSLADQADFERRSKYHQSWSVLPRRCYHTRRWIWGPAVCAEAENTGPGDIIMERRWFHRDEYVILMLKGKTNEAL